MISVKQQAVGNVGVGLKKASELEIQIWEIQITWNNKFVYYIPTCQERTCGVSDHTEERIYVQREEEQQEGWLKQLGSIGCFHKNQGKTEFLERSSQYCPMIPKGEGRSPEKRSLNFNYSINASLKENSVRRVGMKKWERQTQDSNGQDSVRKQACSSQTSGLVWLPRGRETLEESGALLLREAESAGQSKWATRAGAQSSRRGENLTKRESLPSSG